MHGALTGLCRAAGHQARHAATRIGELGAGFVDMV